MTNFQAISLLLICLAGGALYCLVSVAYFIAHNKRGNYPE